MPFGLPAYGETNWHTKINDSIDAVKATADAAQSAAGLDAAVAAKVNDSASSTRSALTGSYVPKSATAPRTPVGVATSTEPTGATTPGSGDMVGMALTHGVKGDHTGVPSTPSAGYFFGLNSYTYTGDQVSDCAGLNILYGNLLEAVVRLPSGGQALGSVFGAATHVAFSGAAAGSTVNRMASLIVQAPTRKDGAVAGTATNIYGLLVEQVSAIGASSTVRSFMVEGGASQLASLLMTSATIDTVASQPLTLTANSTGTGTAPAVNLYPGDHATKAGLTEVGGAGLQVSTKALITSAGYGRFGGTAEVGAQVSVISDAGDRYGLVVRMAASPTVDAFRVENSAGTQVFRVANSGVAQSAGYLTGNSRAIVGEDASGGTVTLTKTTGAAALPGAGSGTLYFRDGTTAGTLKLVVRAGAAGAETTILDNIPQ